MDYRIWVLFVITFFRCGVLSFFVAQETLDLRYLTYINYTLVTVFYLLILSLAGELEKMSAALLALLPLAFNLCFFIGVAIVIIVQLNDWIFMRTTVVYGGPRLVGDVHTGDWVLHQLPVVEILVVMVLYINEVNEQFHYLKTEVFTKLGTVIYYCYAVASGALVVALYFATEDFNKNYPTGTSLGSNAVKITLSLLVCLLVGGVFLLFVSRPVSEERKVRRKQQLVNTQIAYQRQ